MIHRQSELEMAIQLAERLLDEPNEDPDDDLRILSRQLIRVHERQYIFKIKVRELIAFLQERCEYNSHDLGELGKFVKLNYLKNFLADILSSDLLK